MNIEEYEAQGFATYSAFADTVRFIIEQSVSARADVPRPQSIQSRAKGIQSLRRRLAEAERLDTQTLEADRRDLSGIRLVFYTNNDVDRFLSSSLIFENFDVEKESTRVHHPTPDNDSKYRAIHYTVRLEEKRTGLPEYARYAGLRCEIQIQTILNHAWSETSHDILYKHPLAPGYGEKAMTGIAKRFNTIMDKYLIPAGYEFQKAQQEFERVQKGKELFDQDIVKSLGNATNNNELHEVLLALKDYALPNYDDVQAAYEELKKPLLQSVKTARGAPRVPIKTMFGEMKGIEADMVIKVVIEIVDYLRYVDVPGTLQLLIDIYKDEPNERIKRQILESAKRLSEYELAVYRKAGPMVQMSLVDHLAATSGTEIDQVRPVALMVWTECLQSDITGATWKADSVELNVGAVPLSDQLGIVRDKAIRALFEVYERSVEDAQRREVLTALDAATRTPMQGGYPNDLLAATLKDTTRIVEFLTTRTPSMSYELKAHIEHQRLHDFRRANYLIEDADNRFECGLPAADLRAAVLRFRNSISQDEKFEKYKVLVGFESVYPEHWTSPEFDYAESEPYRKQQAKEYLQQINAQNADEWFDLIKCCADTKSSDLATFPVFSEFLEKLAHQHPEIADRFLREAPGSLRRFSPAFLNGLALSARSDIHLQAVKRELELSTDLGGLARHFRHPQVVLPELSVRLLTKAIEAEDSAAVTECLVFALEQFGTGRVTDPEQFIRDVLDYLNEHKDARWVGQAWFLEKASEFYEKMSSEVASRILQNLGYVRKVAFQVERVLFRIAERRLAEVWDYFGARLAREKCADDDKDGGDYEAVPFRFFGLEKQLSRDPNLAIQKGLEWYAGDRTLFQFRGGRVLSNAFPGGTRELSEALVDMVRNSGDTEAEFALAILQNYTGQESTHPILKEIVARFSDDAKKLSKVRSSIDNSGVVSGDLGFAEAWRAKRNSLKEWLSDERPAVKAFAEKHIAELDLMVANEHRRAEAERELWRRDFEDDGAEDIPPA